MRSSGFKAEIGEFFVTQDQTLSKITIEKNTMNNCKIGDDGGETINDIWSVNS